MIVETAGAAAAASAPGQSAGPEDQPGGSEVAEPAEAAAAVSEAGICGETVRNGSGLVLCVMSRSLT